MTLVPFRRLIRAASAGLLGPMLAVSAWAAPPPAFSNQPSPEQIRAMKIEFWQDCCYNHGPATDEALASLQTDLLLQYPARRRAVEAQVPRLNQMFAGRYLGHVVVLDDLKPRLIYFVKNLSTADFVRVQAEPDLLHVQLVNSAYAAGEVPKLAQRLSRAGTRRTLTPQEKAAYLMPLGVRFPSLVSVNALPDAVFIQQAVEESELLPALQAFFGEQLVAAMWNDNELGSALVLGSPRVQAHVHRPTVEQLNRLREDPLLREVMVVESRWSTAEIQHLQQRLAAALMPEREPAGGRLVNMLGFSPRLGKFDIGVTPGKLDEVRRLLSNHIEIPVDCCVLREQPPLRVLGTPQRTQ